MAQLQHQVDRQHDAPAPIQGEPNDRADASSPAPAASARRALRKPTRPEFESIVRRRALGRRGCQASRPRRKAIARTAHGLYQPVVAEVLERLAQPSDVHVDGTLLDVHIAAPDAVEQLLAAVDALRVRHEELEQPVLGRTERHGAFADHDAVPGAIQRRAHRSARVSVSSVAAAAAQHRIDARDQLARGERLGHVVVGATIEAGDLVGLLGPGRQHDDRQVARLALALERTGQFQAAVVRQHPVDQDQVGTPIGQRCARARGSPRPRAPRSRRASGRRRSSRESAVRPRRSKSALKSYCCEPARAP